MIKPERTLSRSLTGITIWLVICLLVGAVLAWLMPWLFYELNPVISVLVARTGWPYQDLIVKIGWFGSSFVGGILLAMLIYFPAQRIRARLGRRRSGSAT